MNAPFLARVLRNYQQRAATFLYESDAAFLIAPLGAGKGAAALTAFVDLVRDEHRRHTLVIGSAPSSPTSQGTRSTPIAVTSRSPAAARSVRRCSGLPSRTATRRCAR